MKKGCENIMFILDLNQVMISNLMMQIRNHTNIDIKVEQLRAMVLNTIRSLNVKFRDEYGEFIIACDNKNSWRRQIFPYYKANRKRDREKSELDWEKIFEALSTIRSELKENFPYRVIDVETAEADDIIATLVKEYATSNPEEKILILSRDKDFIQLHIYDNVVQFDPISKMYVKNNTPELFIKQHIITGDSTDGIPNILSSDNCFVIGERQKRMTSKRLEYFINYNPEEYNDEMCKRNYYRNQYLIDFNYIPSEISATILQEYNNQANKTRSKMFNYFVKQRLPLLMESINQF